METSDDPVTMGVITKAAIGATVSAGIGIGTTALMGGFKKPDTSRAAIGTQTAQQPTKTAEPVVALSEQAKKNRRLAASALTREFQEPTLSIPGLKTGH